MLLTIILATVLVSLISLVGITLLSLKPKTLDAVVFIIVSFATGSLLGAAFFDLMPEAIDGIPASMLFLLILSGILFFFILERLVHWHHQHHDHSEHEKPVAYLVLIGDAVHNFFDGVAIAASFMTSPALGVTTTVAIILHEIPQELSDYTLLTYSGFSAKKALMSNLVVALTAILGAVLFFYLSAGVEALKYYGLAFTAGTFIYIACTDLFPELHKEEERSKSLIQLFTILAGVLMIWAMVNYLKV